MKRRILQWLKVIAIGAITLLIVGDIYLETAGLPEFGRGAVQEWLDGKGLSCDADTVKFGLARGLVIKRFTVWDGNRSGRRMLEAHAIRILPQRLALLRFEFVPSRLVVDDGVLYLPVDFESERDRRYVKVHGLNLDLELDREEIEVSRLSGVLAGIQLNISGRVAGFDAGPSTAAGAVPSASAQGDTAASESLSWRLLLQHQPASVKTALATLGDLSGRYLFLRDDAYITGEFLLDLATPAKNAFRGVANVNDISFRGTPIRKLKGRIEVSQNRLLLDQFTVIIGVDNAIQGRIEADFADMAVAMTIEGLLDPHVLYRFIDRPMPRLLAEMSFASPPLLELRIDRSPFAIAKWTGECRINMKNVVYREQYLSSASITVVRRPGTIEVQDVQIRFGSDESEQLGGKVVFDEETGKATGRLQGSIELPKLFQLLPEGRWQWRSVLRDWQVSGGVVHFTLDLDKSGLTPGGWNAGMNAEITDLRVRGLTAESVTCPLKFHGHEVASVQPLLVILGGADDPQRLEASVSCNLQDLSCAAEGSVRIFPVQLWAALKLPAKGWMEQLHFRGEPLSLSFRLEGSATAPQQWHGDVRLEASDIAFRNLDVQRLTADAELADGVLAVTNIVADTAQLEHLSAAELVFGPKAGAVELHDVAVTGDPRVMKAFLASGRATRIYEKIWDNFTWGESLPQTNLGRLYFRNLAPGVWKLEMDGRIESRGASFRGIATDALAADILLDLPARATVQNIKMAAGQAWGEGNLKFELAGDPVLRFDCKGELDAVRVFSAVHPQVATALRDFSTGPLTGTQLQGSVHLRGSPRPRLECHLDGDYLRFHSLALRDATCDWRMVENEIRWSVDRALLYGGMFQASGLYNSFFRTGRLGFTAAAVDLAQFLAALNGQVQERDLGKAGAAADVEFYRSEAGRPWRINGTGDFSIRDGTIWDAPILQNLGEKVGFGSLGRISSLDATLLFDGDTLKVPELGTDGTLLALTGSGEYAWSNRSLDFRIYGQALKRTSLVPLLLKPLSWFFEAELTGTIDDYEWKLLGPLRRMLPGGG